MEKIVVNPEYPFSAKTFELIYEFAQYGLDNRIFFDSYTHEIEEYVEKPFQKLLRQIAAQLQGQIFELIQTLKLGKQNWCLNKWGIGQYLIEANTKNERLFLQLDEKSLTFGFKIVDQSSCMAVVLDEERVLESSAEQLSTQIAQGLQQIFPLVKLPIRNNLIPALREYNIQTKYGLFECAEKTGFALETLDSWLKAIERKGQAILFGSPGTGKTFIAEQLARYLTGEKAESWELVQFHPAYSYEDFIQGIRPQTQDGQLTYPLVPGRFLEFCQKAESREGLCVLIIDEINRANLAQVFGELMYLLEYRNKKIRLAGSNELFSIPENVRIIGTMNTADRSIALVDHALRRRFAFIELRPNYQVLRQYHEKKKTDFQVEGLIKILERLNNAIANKHYEIGMSFFLTENLAEDIEDIWQMEIEPYLEEYFFDQLDKVDEFRWDKIKKQVCP